jgi:outer membrane protein assembly factor BamA
MELAGQWQVARYGLRDYGLGTGGSACTPVRVLLNQYSTENSDSSFPINYGYIRLVEKGYRRIGKHTFIGAGVRFDLYSNIDDKKQTNALNTPHERYSLRHGFDPDKYSSNGMIVAFQYNSREHPVRSYGGFYGDIDFQFDETWMGSTKNAIRLEYDLRKYFSLSKKILSMFWRSGIGRSTD